MALVDVLFSVLATGAGLVASGATSEFGKGAGKAIFEALKARLTEHHAVKSLGLLNEAQKNPAFERAVKSELADPKILQDAELLELVEQLRAEIEALPAQQQHAYAIDIETIRAGGRLLVDSVEGIRAKTAIAEGDIHLSNVKAPPGK